MHKKIAKAFAASAMAAAMLSTTVAAIAPMSVSAGSCLGESTFEKKALPWHTCETSPASQQFKVDTKNQNYWVKIVNPGGETRGGASRWDLQFRHRKLKIQKGHTYKVHWEVTASTAGDMATQISTLDGESIVAWHNNANDFGSGWDNVQISKGENKFDSEFTADKDIEVAEWAFHYGGQGPHQTHDCFPEGTELVFDNMILECTTCGDTYKEGSCLWDPSDDFGITSRANSGLENNYISVNQVGYYPNLTKKATLGDNAGGNEADIHTELSSSPVEFKVVDASGKAAYTGTSEVKGKDEDSGDFCHILDFSDLKTPGTYHIECGEYKSFDFEIGDDIYSKSGHDLLTNAMNYYYQNRSGIDIEEDYITSGEDKKLLAHIAGHKSDQAYVQPKWQNAYAGEFDGEKTYSIDCTGGWYDAGDHGKYVVNGGVSVWTLQNIYERSVKLGDASKFADGSGAVKVPEIGDKVPDILNETRYELDWMMKMIVDSKDPYWGSKYAGLVYHKMHDHKWTGLATRPYDYESDWGTTRIVKPPTLAATANFAACAAQASRLWKDIDSAYSAKLLDAAKKCYDAFNKCYYEYGTKSGEGTSNTNETSLYAPGDQAKGGGPYGDDKVTDDGYWAACELFATTGDSKYYTDASKYADAFKVVTLLEGGENASSFSSFNWGCTGSLGSLSLYLNPENVKADDLAKIKSSMQEAADTYIAKEDEQAYGIPYRGSVFTDPNNIGNDDSGKPIEVEGYEWGSNSFVINNAIVMAYAYDETNDTKYINGVTTAMDYLLGRNPLSFSFITGYGDYCLQSPHHRYWSKELDPTFPAAPDGILSGGCGSGLQDPYVAGLGYERKVKGVPASSNTVAPQRCFVDSCEAWSVNEVTINWNAPLVWVASFLQDEAPKATNVDNTDKLVVSPTTITVNKGETTTIKPTINGTAVDATFSSSDKSVVDVDASGKVTGVGAGTATITVTANGQTATVNVTVKDSSKPTDPTDPTDPLPTDPTNVTGVTANTDPTLIDKAKWGDVNVDEDVNVADIVALNLYLLNSEVNPVTDQGFVNANCVYDNVVDAMDSTAIMNYVAMTVKYESLGPQK